MIRQRRREPRPGRNGAPEGNGRVPRAEPTQVRRALVCAPVMPEFDREGGSARIYDFILFLRDAGWKVTFVSRHSIGRPDRYVRLLEAAGVVALPEQGDDISDVIRRGRFDLALLAFWHISELYAPLVRALSPHTKIIVDSIDLHFVRNVRQALVQPAGGARPGLVVPSAGDEIVRELNAYAAADAVLTVSEKEAELLNVLLGDQANAAAVPLCDETPFSERPFRARKGLLFVGNFRHAPNVDALHYLCREILPRLPQGVLETHPLFVVGNGVTEEVRQAVAGLPGVRLVGWVPTLVPYLEQARAAVVPLRYGAGTKRKLIQGLMIGTPAVSTSIGTEGMDLRDGEEVLIANDAVGFAAAIVRLLENEALWRRLASKGRTYMAATHGREVARAKFSETVGAVLTTNQKRPQLSDARVDERRRQARSQYGELVERIRALVDSTLPRDACVLVISKGDEALLDLGGRRGWHFPQTANGVYAGHYPGDGAEAIAHLEAIRQQGAQYLVLPSTAFWWLEYYGDFRHHLEQRYRLVCDRSDTCLIFALDEACADAGSVPDSSSRREEPSSGPAAADGPVRSAAVEAVELEELRPQVVPVPRRFAVTGRGRAERVLVIGIYLANQKNTVEDTVARLSESRRYRVRQRWIALGGGPPSAAVAAVTVKQVETPTPKFDLVNAVLAREDLSRYQYVLLVDDDVLFPRAFVDHFIDLQRHFGFALAQPARTSRSFIDHPIVEQQRGSMARQTLFVEIGPVVSFHRSIFDLVFPFDLTSPMGWGYENVWSARVTRRRLTMGIIDAVPVDHSVRPPVSQYRWEDADEGRTAFLHKHRAPPLQECFRVLRIFTSSETSHEKTSLQSAR